jgi:integral membrane sensor domain MASE1
VFALVAAGAAGTAISATFGTTSLRLGSVIPTREFVEVWRTWWLSDFSGALIVTPLLLLAWPGRGLARLGRRELIEAGALLVILVLLAELPSQRDVPDVVFPALIWAALRFGPRGAATALVVVSGLPVWNTGHDAGPFVRESIADSRLSSQLFLAAAALTSLLRAAVTAERTRGGDAKGAITDRNAAAEEILGRRREDLRGAAPRRCWTASWTPMAPRWRPSA